MNSLGTHLLVELKDCEKNLLDNIKEIESIMTEAAQKSGATILDYSFNKFNPYGISGMVIIAESHLSIHTWPEYNYAAVDIFTCGETLEPIKAAHFIIEKLNSKNPSIMEIKRGILTVDNKKIKHKAEAKINDAPKKFKSFQNVY